MFWAKAVHLNSLIKTVSTMTTKTVRNILSGFIILFPILLFSLKKGIVGEWYIQLISVEVVALLTANYFMFKSPRRALMITLITLSVGLAFFGIVYFYHNHQ